MSITELTEIAVATSSGEKNLQAELDKRGVTMEQLKETFNKVIATVRRAWKAVKKLVANFVDAFLFRTTNNPKYYHLYKHAKKYRTRKKYRRKLWQEAILNLTGGINYV